MNEAIKNQRTCDAFIGSGVAGNIFLYQVILLPIYQKIKQIFKGQ